MSGFLECDTPRLRHPSPRGEVNGERKEPCARGEHFERKMENGEWKTENGELDLKGGSGVKKYFSISNTFCIFAISTEYCETTAPAGADSRVTDLILFD